MNARDRLRIMIRSDRGSMTVWSQPEIDDAFATYDAERRAEAFNEAAALLRARAEAYPTRRIFAAGLRHGALRLAKEAMGRTSPADADFFQVGHTYVDDEYDWKFRVDAITTHPEDGERTALGWRFFKGQWEEMAYGEDDWEIHQLVGHTDITETGEDR